ncbi:MAG: hypothetical protein HN368_22285 [Spirochaetales bacterium]|nr:hypothetical protein [Spirochaetales bacterium]
MSSLPLKICYLIIPALLLRCGPFPDLRGLAAGDMDPPMLLAAESNDPKTAVIHFNEPVTLVDSSMSITPSIPPSKAECTDNTLVLTFETALEPGRKYFAESTVRDIPGNQTRFVTFFYGFNPRIPKALINEFIPQGSATHPDLVEIIVLENGNIAGLTIYEGTKENWSDKCIMPSVEVQAGDFLLIHFKPEGKKEEINETESRAASEGIDSSETAWDFWVEGGNGLSGNNGVISLYRNPLGEMIDGVLYSNRTSSSDEKYRGFGTKNVMQRADALGNAEQWITEGDLIAPEDGLNPDPSTSTRSLCRDSRASDTNTKADWHIVPTKGATFGGENSEDVFE